MSGLTAEDIEEGPAGQRLAREQAAQADSACRRPWGGAGVVPTVPLCQAQPLGTLSRSVAWSFRHHGGLLWVECAALKGGEGLWGQHGP